MRAKRFHSIRPKRRRIPHPLRADRRRYRAPSASDGFTGVPLARARGSDHICYLTFGPQRHSRRAAFSMAEMMIAIVILGLGLLMVATMFPIAWTKARTLAEFTNQSSITEAASTTVRLLTRVARPIPGGPPFQSQTSFLGDYEPNDDPSNGPDPSVDAFE